ncbi:PREDICTED: serine hydrolase-like protein [Nicrophorus vespilloides]|uniref:Serine hydrolase-like protein n=1 Tax=Nicrophorus vespilloides TaxID=110193 RepID=A0ABM1N2W8_NICVS|nr:PREDICTED: serine hydrolase-like protein [Nicrophorus vespilloides]
MKIEELQVSAPWGEIAIKLWGEKEDPPILVIHGVMDNVGSFDRLISMLPKHYYYIGIDLPGHGKSSHWGGSRLINSLDNLLVYKIVADYFDRKKYMILAHSWGGQLGFFFAQIYPEYVTKLIMLDTIYLYPTSTRYLKEHIRNAHDQYFDITRKFKTRKAPEYTYEEALDKLMHSRRYNVISQEAAEPLLKRIAIPLENGKIRLSVDQSLKNFFNPVFDFRYLSDFIKKHPVLCPVLIVLSTESDGQNIYFKRIINQLKSYKNIKIKLVAGNHDVHNENPERIAPLVTEFLLRENSKL